MTSPVLFESRHTGGFLVSYANGYRGFAQSALSNGGGSPVLYQAGTVMSVGFGTPTVTRGSGDTGNGTAGGVSILANATPGDYVLTAIDATHFAVVAPTGQTLGTLQTGTAFANQIGLTITAGGTAFVAGDTFVVTVPQAAAASTFTGAAPANAILYHDKWVDAGATVEVTLLVRDAEVNISELIWDPAVISSTDPGTAALQAQALSELAALGIVGR